MTGTGQPDLNQQLIENSGTGVSGGSSHSSTAGAAGGLTATAVLKQPVFGTPKLSEHKLYGSHDSAGSGISSQALQEWPVKDCRDYVVSTQMVTDQGRLPLCNRCVAPWHVYGSTHAAWKSQAVGMSHDSSP